MRLQQPKPDLNLKFSAENPLFVFREIISHKYIRKFVLRDAPKRGATRLSLRWTVSSRAHNKDGQYPVCALSSEGVPRNPNQEPPFCLRNSLTIHAL